LGSLISLCQRETRLKLVVEMGGSRELRWQPLEQLLDA
jgi:NAD(P)H-quinone oxidoreductase subunit N